MVLEIGFWQDKTSEILFAGTLFWMIAIYADRLHIAIQLESRY